MAIHSFKCHETEGLFYGKRIPRFVNFEAVAMRKLAMLQQATVLSDLKVPPGNQLEALKGDRVDQYSIRINQQWRICFRWSDTGPWNVEIVDYH